MSISAFPTEVQKTNLFAVTGSTNIVTPEEFVLNLSNLDRGAGAGLASHTPNSTSFQAPKKGSRPIAAPSDVSQDSMDRRFAAAPPQQRPPPSQYPQQPPSRNSYHAPPQAQGSYAPPLQQQQQASRPPQGYVPSLSHSPTPSQMSSSTMSATGNPDRPEKEKKKKKKLFGF